MTSIVSEIKSPLFPRWLWFFDVHSDSKPSADLLIKQHTWLICFATSVSQCKRVQIKEYMNASSVINCAVKQCPCLPPNVADNRKWVPYFLIRLSVIIWVLGLRPRSRMFLMNSGVRGNGDSKKSLLSTARLLTFHLPNSLRRITGETITAQCK